jgi:hypothetical protein
MAEQLTYPNLKLEMASIGSLIKEEMIDRLFDNNSVVTGQLARSITPKEVITDANGNEILPISYLKYGDYVDDGAERGPGGMPPVRDIASWIKQKRINVPAGFTPEQFAWAVARNIAKKGQRFKKPKPFIEVSIVDVVNRNINNIGEAVALDIDENIQQNYGEIG